MSVQYPHFKTCCFSAILHVMNTERKLFLLLCFLIFTLGVAGAQEAAGEKPEAFTSPAWKMAVLKKSGSSYRSTAFNQNISMTRNDAYRLYLSFDTIGYCYVIQEDDEGKLPFVYKKTVTNGSKLVLPKDAEQDDDDDDWDFRARELPGTSRIYVTVSAQPKQHLSNLIEQYEDDDRRSIERSILSEVLAIRRSMASSAELEGISVSGSKEEPAVDGVLTFFEGRETRVITITFRRN